MDEAAQTENYPEPRRSPIETQSSLYRQIEYFGRIVVPIGHGSTMPNEVFSILIFHGGFPG
jgi:hypothetical protein